MHGSAQTLTYRRPWAAAIDRVIGAVVEPVAAILVVAEVCLLASGVFFRYVLHDALIWSDELATILLLWLAMLGAVVAYRRGEHIRMTALLRRVSEPVKQILDAISSVIVAIFVIEVMPATVKFFNQEQIDLTPALNFPRSYVVLAIMVGLGLILILALLRLSEMPGKVVVGVIAGALVVSAAAWFGRGAFAAFGNVNLLIFFVGLVGACVAIGVPIAFSFGVGTLSYLAITTQVPLNTVVSRMDEGISSLVLLAVPLFIFLGLIMENAGIARRLVEALASLVGHLRGGLNIVLVAAMYLVSGISGSKIADMAAVAPVLFPDMERRGQKRTGMIALLATSGAMAETIPPSLVLIIIGSVTGVSIGALFTAGLLPAASGSIFLVAVALYQAKREALSTTVARAARRDRARAARRRARTSLAVVDPLLRRGRHRDGDRGQRRRHHLHAAGRRLRLSRVRLAQSAIRRSCETVSLSGAILLIIATATAMGWALTQSGFAQQLADTLGHAPGGALGIMLLSVVLFIILGSVLEGIPAMVLFGPLLFPVAKAAGINEVHYAIVAVLAMGVGLFSPPLGIGYYSACAIGKADPEAAVVPILPYLGALVLALIIIALVPWISLVFLPKQPM